MAFFIACKPGWIGPNCIATCPYPTYGHKCINVCKCTKNECDVSEGCIKSTCRYLCFVKKKLPYFKHTFFYCIFSQYLQQMQISLEQRIKDCLYMYQRSCTKLNRPPKWMTHPTNKTTTTPTMTNHYIRHISYLSSSYHQHRL